MGTEALSPNPHNLQRSINCVTYHNLLPYFLCS